MNDQMKTAIVEFVARMPDWIRRDLASKDQPARTRAEEALAAMIVNAVDQTGAD
ncbi:hypothetical protein IAG41_22665 [Sphingomonas sp. JC676]|uniref:hypothetical protein n=1 Tax=Sphingomonas sp. JC676 TaxID=2768065 RepID=UPI001658000E|nr:hypothetical protein [Sphingomonas sp. JC676]MBC9035203.1 hypothetical protein [Sphingomonas sp. JC676]